MVNSEEGKKRSFESDKKIALSALDTEVSAERTRLEKDIIRLEDQIKATKKELAGLEKDKLARVEKINLEYKANISRFEGSIEKNKALAGEKIQSTTELLAEAARIEKMKSYIGEYNRMVGYEGEVTELNLKSQHFTNQIDHARNLPAEILTKAKLPLDNLSIVEGKPLINGMPISNMSDGEKLCFCVDVANLQKKALNLILIDGVEKLSPENRKMLYAKCKEKGVQFICTRTTKDTELIVVEI